MIRLLLRHLAPLAALLLFLCFALPDLDLPGLHYDEALEAATPAALLLNNQPITGINNGVVQIGGLRLPLMVQNHIGAAQVYAAMPFVALMGPTTLALRSMTVFVGALTLAGVYVLTLRLYGRTAAAAAVLWLAAFPSFVFWSRQGAFVTNLAPCFAAWAFAFGAGLLGRQRSPASTRRSALLAGLFAGLAVWAKLSALWLLTGAGGWLLLVWMVQRAKARINWMPRRQPMVYGGIGFLIGVLPIILYNLLFGFRTFAAVSGSASTTYLGTSNLDVLGNLRTRIVQFADVLSSGVHLWYLGGAFPDTLALLSVLLALAALLGGLIVRAWRIRTIGARQPDIWQRDLLMPFLMLACVLQSCFTISALWYTHFAIAVWLPAVVVGVAVRHAVPRPPAARQAVPLHQGGQLLQPGGQLHQPGGQLLQPGGQPAYRGSWLRWGVILALGLVVASHAWTSAHYLDALRLTGGLSFHSSAIGDV
ncbi:MAG: glycosyltransferase family 39 protein, partial [Roseiflexaceae bacterium]|nr:glycosyltransferase family 39 protein [Roseiflexaceae bacterium]